MLLDDLLRTVLGFFEGEPAEASGAKRSEALLELTTHRVAPKFPKRPKLPVSTIPVLF